MADQEVYDIVMRVLGEDKVRDLTRKIEEQEKALRSMLSAMQANGATQAQMVAATTAQATAIRNLGQELKVAQAEMSKFSMSQNGLLKLGYILDDLQYVGEQGIRPIINNLMVLEPRIGIVALLFDQLWRNAGKWAEQAGLGATKSEADAMEELAKKTEKTADETARLLKYERERANVKAQGEGQPKFVSEMASEVNKVIGEFGRDKLVSAMMGMDPARFRNLPENAQDVAKADALERTIRRRTNNGAFEDDWQVQEKRQELAKVQAKIDATSREKAAEMLGEAAGNPGLLQGLVGRLTQNPNALGAGGMGLIQKLMAAGPEYKEAQEQNDKTAQRAESRKAAAKERERAQDEEDDRIAAKDADQLAWFKRQRQRREQIENRQRQQEGDQQNWNNAPVAGSGGMLQSMMLNALRLGGNPNAIAGQAMAGMMAQRGINVQDARRMVDDASFQARMERGKELLDQALPSDIRSSQVIGASSLANQIQSSITNKDDPRRMVNEQIKGNYLLQMILQETRRRQGVVFR